MIRRPLILAALVGTVLSVAIFDAYERRRVVPIAWDSILSRRAATQSDDVAISKHLLQRSACYGLSWIGRANADDNASNLYKLPGIDENAVRTASSTAYGLATLLATKTYDPDLGCFSEETAKTRTIRLIRGIIAAHKVNRPDGWGQSWQSALWATYLGQAGWMLWNDLDASMQAGIKSIVLFEVIPFIQQDYRAPYWIDRNGTVNFPGDTKAEENAWNAGILLLAMAMMPNNASSMAWRRAANDLLISALAFRDDLTSSRIVDSRQVGDWIDGYNVRDDGSVENHDRIHPDYMTAPTISLRSYVIQPLAGQKPLDSASFNADRVYKAFDQLGFYQKGTAEIRYPSPTDWSNHRVDIFYLYDLFADRLGFDGGMSDSAKSWKALRARKLLEMQQRSSDGRLYQPGEFDTWKVSEQYAMTLFADAFIFSFLADRGEF